MTVEQAAAFISFSFVAAVTPGPSNVMLTATGAAGGMLRGLPALVGVGAGMAAMLFAVAMGLGAIVLGRATLLVVIKWAGAAFLLWLAWKIASAPIDQGGDARGERRITGFAGAFALQWLNPKAWLVCTGASAAYLRPDEPMLQQALQIAAMFFIVTLPCGFVWLGFGMGARRLLAAPKFQRGFNVVMGLLLAGSVVPLLI
ncbi:MAG TPA: LysE family translocator [Burkholderiales bacterium]|nr:LysE family translocator [Burkholderiales bacterium]